MFVCLTETPVNHPAWSVRDDGVVLRDGTPFFPISIYSVMGCPANGNDVGRGVRELKENGFNLVGTYLTAGSAAADELFAACAANGVAVHVQPAPAEGADREATLFRNVLAGRTSPATLGWETGDDTGLHRTPDAMRRDYGICRAVDPTALVTQSDICQYDGRYEPYVPWTDVFKVENYPIYETTPQPDELPRMRRDLGFAFGDLGRSGQMRRGIWSIVQSFVGWSQWHRYPSVEELRAMTWLAVASGANGISYYTYFSYNGDGATSSPERLRELFQVTRELSGYADDLVAADAPEQPAVMVRSGARKDYFSAPPVVCRLKASGLLVAVSTSEEPVVATFVLPSGKSFDAAFARNGVLIRRVALPTVTTGATVAAGAAEGDPSDDLIGWWRVRPATNGSTFEPSDLVNEIHAGRTASAVNHQVADGAFPSVPVAHVSADITCMGHVTRFSEPCLWFPQPTNYTAEGTCVANRQNVVVPVDDVDIRPRDPCTFVIRMKYRGAVSANAAGGQDQKTVCAFDYSYGENRGWRLYLRPDGANWFYPALYVGGKDVSFSQEFTAAKDQWFDIGVSMEPDVPKVNQTRVVFYVWKPFDAQSDRKAVDSTLYVQTNVVNSVSGLSDRLRRTMLLGSNAGSSAYGPATEASEAFRGLIHGMKLYRRALSIAEFKQACAPTSCPTWSAGVRNGSCDEFADEDPAAVFEPQTMGWSRMRKTLTDAAPSVTIRYALPDVRDFAVPCVLEIVPAVTDVPFGGRLAVTANGRPVETFRPKAGEPHLVWIDADLRTAGAPSGTLTVTLERVGSGTGTVAFDCIRLGGGWALGRRDEKYDELCGWGHDYLFNCYYIAKDEPSQAFPVMYVKNGNDDRMNHAELVFPVPDATAASCAFVLTTRLLGNCGQTSFYVNGEYLSSHQNAAYKETFSVAIPKGTLRGGLNEIRMVLDSIDLTGGTLVDYMVLEPVRSWQEGGLSVILR